MNLEENQEKARMIVDNAIRVIKEKLMNMPLYAEVICQQLVKACPEEAEGFHLLGLIKQRLQEYDESVIIINRAIELDPSNADNYNNLALSYANLGDYQKAISYLDKAISIKNNYLYYNNLALQYRQIRDYKTAIDLFDKAIELNQDKDPQLWNNLGGVYGELKDLENAERCFLRASEIDSTYSASHVDLAFTYHLRGEWERGFNEYEWRTKYFNQLDHYKKTYDQSKKWDGKSSVEGKTILIYGEQGLGDIIQFSRYVKNFKKLGAKKTILHCPEVLRSILSRVEGIDEIVVVDIVNKEKVNFPDYDYQCMSMSMPYLFKDYEIDGKPYLKSLATLPFDDYKSSFNIGILWAGSPAHPNDATRSMFLKEFKPLNELDNVKLFNLQVNYQKRIYTIGKRIVDLTDGCEDMKMVDLTQMIESFDDTATIISGLDLVISVDTAIIHLCGALGVPCWVLVPYNPDWRWGLEGDKTPWYDSLKLYRQNIRDNWSEVIERVKQDVLLLQNK